ncbi:MULTISPECIES: PDZ domain-containing protein [unclassified Streptomyces]|uniref:PDZ domain-containing protein n=1 Tax=unclassified Streptomyces TaxID=2593676 RepID=UPI0029AAB7F7|nr:PDZ domain-containing protein [Streptomyces sp. FL07-04A]MDX3579538.1 PDZ domain-containing protein [Streptomyces sp. FL07-04A]
MEQTALRPKPLPGQDPDGAAPPSGQGRRPHIPRRGGRGPTTLVAGLLAGTVLVLSGVGLGAAGATVVGMSRLAELQRQAELAGRAGPQVPAVRPRAPGRARDAGTEGTQGTAGAATGSGAGGTPARDRPGTFAPSAAAAGTGAPAGAGASSRDAGASLGLEAVDAGGTGAEIVAVHVPGPGFTAGLVRGDVLLTFGGAEVGSAADLARAVDRARPGARVEVTVRHRGGGHRKATVVPGIVT